MKKLALFAAASFALTLAACGDTDDASEDAMADNVELPADEAMANVPDPAADATTAAEEATAEEQANAEEAGDAALVAATDAQAAADAAAAAEATEEPAN